ncbi:MAG: hypothetical protein ABR95_01175 [Sphingobacteriales bacterium BACL12 MAG-120813-bin55]|nr:MAG: hypothetical protein ABR95_01175 [Sphingobacteriales bacterium BACL12 MAG-120813-bin55]
MDRYKGWLESRLKRLVRFMKTTSLPGFSRIPLYDFWIFFSNEIKRDLLPVRASAISFNFLIAIFPSIIFLFTLIPYIPVKDLNIYILNMFQEVLPESGYEFLKETIDDIVSIKRGGLLSFGFVLAFIFSTNGVRMLMLAFNKDHPIYRRRGFWRRRVASVRLTFYLFMLFLASILLIIAGDHVLGLLREEFGLRAAFWGIIFTIIKWLFILLLFFSTISLIYYYGPSQRNNRRFITPGASFATLMSIIASLAFGYFVNNFGVYNQVYGSIGTLIVLMLWININSLVLLVGFEINNSVEVNKDLKVRDANSDE